MKVNKNLLVGLGIGLLAYYLYTRSKKKVEQSPVEEPKGGGGAAHSPISGAIKPINNNVATSILNKRPSNSQRPITKPSQNQMFADKRKLNQTIWDKKPLGYDLISITQKDLIRLQ